MAVAVRLSICGWGVCWYVHMLPTYISWQVCCWLVGWCWGVHDLVAFSCQRHVLLQFKVGALFWGLYVWSIVNAWGLWRIIVFVWSLINSNYIFFYFFPFFFIGFANLKYAVFCAFFLAFVCHRFLPGLPFFNLNWKQLFVRSMDRTTHQTLARLSQFL